MSFRRFEHFSIGFGQSPPEWGDLEEKGARRLVAYRPRGMTRNCLGMNIAVVWWHIGPPVGRLWNCLGMKIVVIWMQFGLLE